MLDDFTVHTIKFQLCSTGKRERRIVIERSECSENAARERSEKMDCYECLAVRKENTTKSDAISLSTCTCRALKNEQQRATFELNETFEEMQIDPLVACYFFRVQRRDG